MTDAFVPEIEPFDPVVHAALVEPRRACLNENVGRVSTADTSQVPK